jgi:hypothetical protein
METHVVIHVLSAIIFHDIVWKVKIDVYSVGWKMHNEGKWYPL